MWMNSFWTNLVIDGLLFVYVLDCVFMGIVIMMQRSKQEGLGAAFGGGITEQMWGAQTSQVLVKATVGATIIFFILSITLARLESHRATLMDEGSNIQQELMRPVAPVMPAKPLTPSSPSHPTPTNSVLPAVPASALTPAPASGTVPTKATGK
jgi:preprotein translocase subunit SecG